MGILDDTAIFTAIVQEGGFSHAAKSLGLSNGLISRRIANLEAQLGVTLIKRTTRQLQLTPEGELFWQHAQRIQQELNEATTLIQSLADKPTGHLYVSAPLYFGRHHLMPLIVKFQESFPDVKIDLILTNQYLDPIKENLDLLIRGTGYVDHSVLKDSNMRMKLLFKQKIQLYASPDYLIKHGEPKTIDELINHQIIGYVEKTHLPVEIKWAYKLKNHEKQISLTPTFNCNDVESGIYACSSGLGIGRFSAAPVQQALRQQQLKPILTQYDWGCFDMYAVYSNQASLPKRTRLFLDFIACGLKNLCEKQVCC
ncbi:MAG: hypothetical protein ACD_21C00155G0003 [uncultured bacterium]|nr:MAG: hypothetical protein ACD_21C00155G0003 [uncultured bacterium]